MDSLTTVKHQSSQLLLQRSSKAEENNTTSTVEQGAFITDRGKQQLFPLFSLSQSNNLCAHVSFLFTNSPLY